MSGILPDGCRLKVHLQMPLICNMDPPCPYCGIYRSLHSDDVPPVTDVRRWFVALDDLSRKRGPLHVACLHGEPFADRDLMRVLGRLSEHNLIDCFSNMIRTADVIRESFGVPENLWVTASFHPHHWADVASFAERVADVRSMGVRCDRVFLVAFPPNIPRLQGWIGELVEIGLTPYVMPFTGELSGARYPEAHTDEEWSLISRYLAERFGEDGFMTSRKGRLCRAGIDIVFVDTDGAVRSCPSGYAHDLGNLLDGTMRTLDAPRPCLAPHCQCPDLWRLIISD